MGRQMRPGPREEAEGPELVNGVAPDVRVLRRITVRLTDSQGRAASALLPRACPLPAHELGRFSVKELCSPG